MRRLALTIPLLLAACATIPEPRIVTKEVLVPVSQPCIRKSDIPVEPKPIGALPANASQAADLLAAKLIDYKAGWKEMLAIVGPCTSPTEVRKVD